MTDRCREYCLFNKGPVEYTNVETRPVDVSRLEYDRTLATARVCHASGEWVKWGSAYRVGDEIELYYQTGCAGEIGFERYAIELEFRLTGTPFEPDLRCRLAHDPDGYRARDITHPNAFDECALGFGWVYDNGWELDGETWESYGGSGLFSKYQVLHKRSGRALMLCLEGAQPEVVWSGLLTTNLEFDAMLAVCRR